MTSADLRVRIGERLHPLSAWDPAVAPSYSDFDLSPEFRPDERPILRDAAVLVPIVEHETGLSVILTRRADTLAKHTGQVALPGGRLDPGEGPVEAALREAWEEIGLDPGLVEPLGLSDRYETVTGYAITPVVGLVRPSFSLNPNPGEVAEVFETPFDYLMDPRNHLRESVLWGGRPRYYYTMPWEGQKIWGATAGMLRVLWDRLYGTGQGLGAEEL